MCSLLLPTYCSAATTTDIISAFFVPNLMDVDLWGLPTVYLTVSAAYMYHYALPGTLRMLNNSTRARMTAANTLTTAAFAFWYIVPSSDTSFTPPTSSLTIVSASSLSQ